MIEGPQDKGNSQIFGFLYVDRNNFYMSFYKYKTDMYFSQDATLMSNKYTRLVVIRVLSVLLFFVLVGNSGAATPSCLGPVWLDSCSYDTIQSAYNNASADSTFIYIEGTTYLGMPFIEDLIFSGKDIRLLGGYTCDFQTQDDYSAINGFLSVDSGTVEMSNIVLTSIPPGTIILQQSAEAAVTLKGGCVQFFKFTTPAGGCSASANQWLVVTLINVNLAAGDGQLLVKSSNHGASSWPALSDYTSLFGVYGYSLGSDWTRDPSGGVFFWRWDLGAASESLAILPSYAGHNFNQDDTYYLLLYNQGTVQNQYRVLWRCS